MSDPVGGRRYCLITPCRDEAAFARKTLDAVVAQTEPPSLWVIVDDGSRDDTPGILDEYGALHSFIRVVRLQDRGYRKVGGGVIDAFEAGYQTIDPSEFEFVCKLDLDLELPRGYFADLIDRMVAEPRLGTFSGKPYFRHGDRLVSERIGNENSAGMTKFYRTCCYEAIGGFVHDIMWDGIDGHRCRMLGWIAASSDDPELRFVHLRPMGTSDRSWWTGRVRHGRGQWFMGTGPGYLVATAIFRMSRPPRVVGGLGMLWGYFTSALRHRPRYPDPEFRRFLRRYQRRALLVGKERATRDLNDRQQVVWQSRS